jgi:hypothetical protein
MGEGAGAKSTMSIRSQVTKRGKTDLNQSLMYTPPTVTLIFFYFPLFNLVAKKIFLGRRISRRAFAPPPRNYAYVGA